MSRPPAKPPAASALDSLADEVFDQALAFSPLSATMLGIRDHDAELPDLSRDAEDRRIAELDDQRARAVAVDPSTLELEDRLTRAVILHATTSEADELRARPWHLAAGPFHSGAHAFVLQLLPKVVLAEPAHAEDYLTRLRAVPRYLDQARDRLLEGIAENRTPPRRAVDASVAQLDAWLDGRLPDPLGLVEPPSAWDGATRFRADVADVIDRIVRPAMAGFRTCLADEVAPGARPDERSGLCHVPDGTAAYADATRANTTTERSPEQIHELGERLVEGLAQEYLELGGALFGTSRIDEVFARLRDDPALRFRSAEEVEQAARAAIERATDAADRAFRLLPDSACAVRAMPPHEAAEAPLAYYQPPALDGSSPGTYWVNASEPETRLRFEAEAVAFHEGVPGHHFQIALAQQLTDLPSLRRHGLVTAYVEGWALYAERLADELDLYSGPIERLGMLSNDSLRACRLVVDTGLHQLGWTRQQAVDYFRSNSPQAYNVIETEVDRYIAWPGQALAYMVGRLEIQALRARAQDALSADFDVRDFHDAVLRHGSLPLSALGEVLDEEVLAGGIR